MTIAEMKKKFHAFSDSVLSDLKYALGNHYTIENACRYADINKDTYYRWIKLSDEFKSEMERAQDRPINTCLDILYGAVEREKDPELAFKIIERLDKKRYSLRTESTGAEGEPINPVSKFASDEDIEEFIKWKVQRNAGTPEKPQQSDNFTDDV
jgi:hypothetical protein